jgi:uncharacterized protein YkwD
MTRRRAMRWLAPVALSLAVLAWRAGTGESSDGGDAPSALAATDMLELAVLALSADSPTPPTTTTTTTTPPPPTEPPTPATVAPPPPPQPPPPPPPPPPPTTARPVAPKTSVAPVSSPAPADTGAAAKLLALVNEARAAVGVAPLTRNATLEGYAASWARELAATGVLKHSGTPKAIIGKPWTAAAENVGYGTSVLGVHESFLASGIHRANILGAQYTDVGIGVAVADDGRVWVVEIFAG